MLYESKSAAEQPVIISIGHFRHFLFVYSAKTNYNTLITEANTTNNEGKTTQQPVLCALD